MSPKIWIVLGALSAAIAVGLGAYHAHGLEKALGLRGITGDELQKEMHSFEVGVRYQMFHALGLILLGLLAIQWPSRWLLAAGGLFIIGTLLFSSCLYLPVMLGAKFPPLLVPFGGLAYIVGWIALAIGAIRKQPATS